MMTIHRSSRFLAWSTAALCAMVQTACTDPVLGLGGRLTSAPQVTAVAPRANATGVPTNTRVITAAFSQAMDPATLTPASFTLACPLGTPILGGTVSYVAASRVATLTLPATNLPADTGCTGTITTAARNTSGTPLAADFVWTFTTGATADNTAPTVTSTVPASAATGVAINSLVTASFSEPIDPLTLTAASFSLACPTGTPIGGTVGYAVSGNVATFTPTGALPANTFCTATLSTAIEDVAGNPMAAPYTWTFRTGDTPDTTPPTVTATVPAPGATGVARNSNITASFSEPMNPLTITTVSFSLACPAGTPVTGTVGYAQSGNVATFNPQGNLPANTDCTATITTSVEDVAGNAMASAFTWTFRTSVATDTTAPTVIATVPAANATGVSINTNVTATFSESMDPLTITNASFTLACPVGVPVAGNVSFAANANTAIFTPQNTLPANTVCTATVSTGVRDAAGNAMASPYTWSFTTGATADNTAPTVVQTNPDSNASGVCPDATINATFSEPMDPLTLTTATFRLRATGPPVGPHLGGTVTYDAPTNVATFTPTDLLVEGRNYTVTITTDAQDVAGNGLVIDEVWTFTAGPATGACLQPAPLGSAAPFGMIGGSAGMTNQGISTVVNGDIATTAVSSAVTGFHDSAPGCTYTETGANIGLVNGLIYTAPPPPTIACPTEGTAATFQIAQQARADAQTAYDYLAGLAPTGPIAANLAGLTVPPGVYFSATGFSIQNGSIATTGDLTLDGQGNANAVWVFQSANTLLVGGPGAAFPRSVNLVNGAQAKNVFWQVGSAATINAGGNGVMKGTLIAQDGVAFSTAGNPCCSVLDGRALSLGASVTVVNTVINVPAP